MEEVASKQPLSFSFVSNTDLRQNLWKAQQQGKLVDFHIRLHDMDIPCHKIVLAAESNYFSRKFQREDMEDTGRHFEELQDFNKDAVRLAIQYMYCGRIRFEYNMTREVIKVLNGFELFENILQKQISEYIIANLCTENCVSWFDFGDEMKLTRVSLEAQAIIMVRPYDVSKTSEFLELNYNRLTLHLSYVLCHNNNHDQGLKASIRWIMHDVKNRADKFEDICKIIDFNSCSPLVLNQFCKNEAIYILPNSVVRQNVIKAVRSFVITRSSDVIVTGGFLDGDVRNNKTWLLNLASGWKIELKKAPHANHWYAARCTTGDGVIFAGGSPTGELKGFQTECVLYHTNTDTWLPLPPLPAPTAGAGATCVQDTFLMVVGGFGARRNKAVCLDMRTRNWTILPDMRQGIVFPIVGSIDEYVFVIASTCTENDEERKGSEISMQCYNPTTNTWSFKSPLHASIQTVGAQAVTFAGQLYVVGGYDKICATYNPVLNNWTILESPRYRHMYGAAIVMNKHIILFGGNSGKKGQASIEKYDPYSNTWRLLSVKLPAPLFSQGIALG